MKTLSFSLIIFTFCYSIIELFSYAAYRIKFGDYSLYEIQTSKHDAIKNLDSGGVYVQGAKSSKEVKRRNVLHPYLGYVVDGKIKKDNCVSKSKQDCYSRIKVATDFPLFKKSNDKLNVAILGGSVAGGTSRAGKQTFIDEFSNSGLFDGRDVVIYNLAGGGYKQPQQLMNLAFYYSLGAEFDIVINLDGFNELAASYLGFRDHGLHPAFPVHWNARVASAIDPQYMESYSDKRQLRKDHAASAQFFLIAGIRHSPLMNLVWRLMQQRHSSKLFTVEQAITNAGKTKSRDFDYEALGPDFAFSDWDTFFDDISQIWVNSSLAIHALAEGRGAKYYHYLQPNQYIKGSKPLSEIEKNEFVLDGGSYGNIYRNSRDILVEKAKQLPLEGVNYYDLTYIFKDNPNTLYVDNCCHLNSEGYRLVATEIVRLITEDISSSN